MLLIRCDVWILQVCCLISVYITIVGFCMQVNIAKGFYSYALSDQPMAGMYSGLCVSRVECGAPPLQDPKLLCIKTIEDDLDLHQFWYVQTCRFSCSLPLHCIILMVLSASRNKLQQGST